MIEKTFFELLKGKISALRPSEAHRSDDWLALEAQLDEVLPQEKKRRPLLLPFLLFTGLLLSNGVWWVTHNKSLSDAQKMGNQIHTLQKAFDSIANKSVINHTDTVWRTIYIEKTKQTIKNTSNFSENRPLSILDKKQEKNAVKSDLSEELTPKMPNIGTAIKAIEIQGKSVENSPKAVLQIAKLPIVLKILPSEMATQTLVLDNEPIIIAKKSKAKIFKTPSVKIGLKADYISPRSTGLTAQSGVGLGIESSIGFTKHLSLVGAIGMARFNYIATQKDAILGSPEELPASANQPNTSIQMHMKNQGCMHYDLSLRYTFSPIGHLKPFIGVGVCGMVLSPFQMGLEVQNMQTMVIQQSNFQVTPKMHQQNMVHVSSGFNVPISQRLSVSFEGYYMRQWQKMVALSPDFIGIRTGVHYGF